MREMMNVDVANNWPLIVVTLPGEKAIQNESPPPIPLQDNQRPTILDNGSEMELNHFWAKGSFIDIYI